MLEMWATDVLLSTPICFKETIQSCFSPHGAPLLVKPSFFISFALFFFSPAHGSLLFSVYLFNNKLIFHSLSIG